MPYEIHPNTPLEGILWQDYFPGMNLEAFFRQLDERGQTMGIRFGCQTLISNSRMALAGGEFAKEQGKFESYHEAVFRAIFRDGKDVGNRAVLLKIAGEVGLDTAALSMALKRNTYLSRLQATTQKAKMNGFQGAPTFVLEGYGLISGAQPIDTFRQILLGRG